MKLEETSFNHCHVERSETSQRFCVITQVYRVCGGSGPAAPENYSLSLVLKQLRCFKTSEREVFLAGLRPAKPPLSNCDFAL